VVRAVDSETEGRILVAYVVAGDPSPSVEELLEYAVGALPEFAVPRHVEFLDALPLTPNGKVDVRALPAPRIARPRPEFSGSTTPLERRVLKVWGEVLGYEVSSPIVSFFAAGGSSLLALTLYLRLRQKLAVPFRLHDLFAFPTARAFAANLSSRHDDKREAGRATGPPTKSTVRAAAIARGSRSLRPRDTTQP
jgi:hypothetical protein